jgi:hypothetical protein
MITRSLIWDLAAGTLQKGAAEAITTVTGKQAKPGGLVPRPEGGYGSLTVARRRRKPVSRRRRDPARKWEINAQRMKAVGF